MSLLCNNNILRKDRVKRMASQQTPNYKLSRWAGTDRILVEEFNDNWDKIDAAIAGRQDAGGTFAAELPSGGVQRVESPLGNAATVKVTGSQLKSTYVCKGTRLRLWGIR